MPKSLFISSSPTEALRTSLASVALTEESELSFFSPGINRYILFFYKTLQFVSEAAVFCLSGTEKGNYQITLVSISSVASLMKSATGITP